MIRFNTAFITVQDCDIVYSDGKDSTYISKETEQIKIRPEAMLVQSLDDKCLLDLKTKTELFVMMVNLRKIKLMI